MKKKYVEPVMVVEDFNVSETIAKCEFISSSLFTNEMAHTGEGGSAVCKKARDDAYKRDKHAEFDVLSDLYSAGGDFDNADNDYDWRTNNTGYNEAIGENKNVFTSTYATASICQIKADNMTFMDYPNKAFPEMPACAKDSGSSLLQNS